MRTRLFVRPDGLLSSVTVGVVDVEPSPPASLDWKIGEVVSQPVFSRTK